MALTRRPRCERTVNRIAAAQVAALILVLLATSCASRASLSPNDPHSGPLAAQRSAASATTNAMPTTPPPAASIPSLDVISTANAARLTDLATGGQAIERLTFAGNEHVVVGRRESLIVVRVRDGSVVRRIAAPGPWAVDRTGRLCLWSTGPQGGAFTLQTLEGQTVQTLRTESLRAAASGWFTRDGSRFAALLSDRRVHVWDTTTGHDVGNIAEPSGPSGDELSEDGSGRVVDLGSGRAQLSRIVGTPVDHEVGVPFEQVSDGLITGSVAIAANGTRALVDYGGGRSFGVFDVVTGQRIARGSRATQALLYPSLSRDGQSLVGVADGRAPALLVAPLPNITPIARVPLPALRCPTPEGAPPIAPCVWPAITDVDVLRFQSASDFLVVARVPLDGDRESLVVARPNDVFTVPLDGRAGPSFNSARFEAVSDDGTVLARQSAPHTQIALLTGRAEAPIRLFTLRGGRLRAHSPDASLVASGEGSSFSVWRTSDGRSVLQRAEPPDIALPDGRTVTSLHVPAAHALALAARAYRRLAAPSSILSALQSTARDSAWVVTDDAVTLAYFAAMYTRSGVFDLSARQLLWQDADRASGVDAGPPVRHSTGAISPDGRWVVAMRGGSDIDLIEARTGQVRASQQAAGYDEVVRFTPDGGTVLCIRRDGPRHDTPGVTVRAYDGSTLAPRWHAQCATSVEIGAGGHVWMSRAGDRVAIMGGGRLCVFDVGTGAIRVDAALGNAGCGVVDAHREQYVVAVYENSTTGLRRWSLRDGSVVPPIAAAYHLPYESGRSDCARGFAADGAVGFVALAVSGGHVRVVDAATGQPLRELASSHTHDTNAVAVSPNGLVAAVDERTTLTLWDGNTGARLAEWPDQGDRVAFEADGRLLVTWQSVWNGRPNETPPLSVRAVVTPR